MFNHILLMIAFFSVVNHSLFAIEIQINAPDYQGKNVKWRKKTDHITNQYQLLAESKIDTNGLVTFNKEIEKIELTEIVIGRSFGLLYLDTATKFYNIYFPKDTILDTMSLKKNQIQLVFLDLPENDINQLILDFNLQYDYFLYGDTAKLIRLALQEKEFQDSLNAFKVFISDRYQNDLIKFLHVSIRYEIALIEQMAHQSKGEFYKNYLFHTYLKKSNVEYANPAFMEFFNLFYRKPFKIGGDEIFERIKFSINQYHDLDHLKNAMSNSSFYSHQKLTELIIIKGLYDNYNSREFSNAFILELLEEISENGNWAENRSIAEECLRELSFLKNGTAAPNFSWIDVESIKHELIDFKGKHIYIHFFSSLNYMSLKEMEIIEQLADKYSAIQFISVNLDETENSFSNFLRTNKYKWEIGRPQNPQDVIELFKLDHLPTYIFIDPNGVIVQYPAYTPSPMYNNQSIDVTFFNLQKKLDQRQRLRIGVKG